MSDLPQEEGVSDEFVSGRGLSRGLAPQFLHADSGEAGSAARGRFTAFPPIFIVALRPVGWPAIQGRPTDDAQRCCPDWH